MDRYKNMPTPQEFNRKMHECVEHKKLTKLKSCIVNTVHDSIVIDVHPDEKQDVIQILSSINSSMKNIIDSQFKIDFNVPLLLEAKIGNNWLDTKDVL